MLLTLSSAAVQAAPPGGETGAEQEQSEGEDDPEAAADPAKPEAGAGEGEGAGPEDDAGAGAGNRAQADARALSAARVRKRAAQIDALRAGELDAKTDVARLFAFDLSDPLLDELGPLGLRALLVSVQQLREDRAAFIAAREAKISQAPRRQQARLRAELPRFELPAAPVEIEADAGELQRAHAQLFEAYWNFLVLPHAERRALLEAHAQRHAEQLAASEALSAAQQQLTALVAEGEALEAFMRGELELERDPAELLSLELGDVGELADDARLAGLLGATAAAAEDPTREGETSAEPGEQGGDPSPEAGAQQPEQPAGAPEGPLAAEIAAARAHVDALRLSYLELPPEQRRRLLAQHEERRASSQELDATDKLLAAEAEIVAQVEEDVNEAEDKAAAVRREREAAERAAVAARTEAMRRIAEERARLLGVKESHANYEVELAKHRRATLEAHEIALGMDHEVAELTKRREGSERESDADQLYEPLRDALEQAQVRLHEDLSAIARGESGVASVGEPLAGVPQGIDRSELSKLREELEASEERLREEEREARWVAADSGRDDIVMLNSARLVLLELGSVELRELMTGFGADGVDQARREARQIVLELRYRLLSLPRLGRGLFDAFEEAPVPILFALLQLVFAGLVFRYWRRRADETLDGWRDYFHQRERGNPRLNSALAHGFWYIDRVRKPLEVLALGWVAFRMLRGEQALLELEVAWLVLLWLMLGSTVVLLVDSIAMRENIIYGGGSGGRAELRIRSLRLVGLTVVISGLVLSLTGKLVGEGAIYHWVGGLVWFAAIPVLAVLIRWWREHAFRRVQDDPEIPDNALVRWIRANSTGLASFAAAAVAGAYLFGRGLARWLLHRATNFDATRSALAWMFRREVARQANARAEDQRPTRQLDAQDYACFDPNLAVDVADIDDATASIAQDLLDEVIALKVAHRGTLSAVIGERGSGKSTFLRRLEHALELRAEDYVHNAESEPKRANSIAEGEEQGERHAEYGRLTIRRIQCPPGGFRMLQRSIAESIGLSRHTKREELVTALSEQTPLVFLIDDVHRLVRPAIGGLGGLDDFADFAREVSGDASWIATIGKAAWQYVSRSRGERVFFDQVLSLPRWKEEQIGALLRARSKSAAIRPSFEGIVIPQQFDVATFADLDAEQRPSAYERAERGYYRILWDYARGNPAVALHFWRESLCVAQSAGEEDIEVRLFTEPPATALDEVGPTIHFVLRGVVQLEIASPEDLVACTQLPPADVADALRFAHARGWIDRVGRRGERYRVTWHWYRAVTNMLNRQHLLVM